MTREEKTTQKSRLSLWIGGLTCLVVTCGGFALFLWLAVPGAGAGRILAGALIFCAPTTAMATAGLAVWRYRRQWTDDEWLAMTRAFRSGRPPAGTELDERLLETISRRRLQWRRARRYGPWICGVILVADLVDLLVEQKGSAVVGIIVASIVLVCVFLLPPITLRRMDRLEAAIAQRQSQSGS
jgi:hypothetical protein